jgi:hypothetical protein
LIEGTDSRVANSLHLVPPSFRDDFFSTADLGKSGLLRKARKVGFLRRGPRRPTCEESTLVAPPAGIEGLVHAKMAVVHLVHLRRLDDGA